MVGRSACATTPREIVSGLTCAQTFPCRDVVGEMYSATSGFVGSPFTLQERIFLTGAAIGDPTKDNGTGMKGMATGRTRMDRPTGAV